MDRELAAALAGELPAAAKVKVDDALPVSLTCPSGSRGAAFYLPDGQVSVIRLPLGASMAFDSGDSGRRSGNASASTSTGSMVVVVSVAARSGEPPPYESDLSGFARAIAGIY